MRQQYTLRKSSIGLRSAGVDWQWQTRVRDHTRDIMARFVFAAPTQADAQGQTTCIHPVRMNGSEIRGKGSARGFTTGANCQMNGTGSNSPLRVLRDPAGSGLHEAEISTVNTRSSSCLRGECAAAFLFYPGCFGWNALTVDIFHLLQPLDLASYSLIPKCLLLLESRAWLYTHSLRLCHF